MAYIVYESDRRRYKASSVVYILLYASVSVKKEKIIFPDYMNALFEFLLFIIVLFTNGKAKIYDITDSSLNHFPTCSLET